MPPRRSTRAASVKPQPAKPEVKKSAVKAPARARTATKRPAPVEDESRTPSPTPPTKRRRAGSRAAASRVEPPEPKAKPAPKKPIEKKKVEKIEKEQKPYFNPLPTPPEHLRPAPQLFAWGAGNFGQFGMGENSLGELEKPQRNKLVEQKMQEGVYGEEGAGLEAVAAGGMYSLFVDEKGTIWSCGTNDDAALGRITSNVPNPDKEGEFLDIDTLTSQPFPLQSLVDQNFRAVRIAAGDSISAAISSQGDLQVWGSFRGVEGLLGFSSGQKHQFLPVPILDLPSKPGDAEKFTAVAAGNNHLVVLTTHGHVYTWGAGEQGQLGRKVLERRKIHGTTPEKIVLGGRSHKAVVIGAGNYTSFAVDEKGDRSPTPEKKVIGLSKKELGGDETVVQITGGEHHTLFLTSTGKVYACGRSNGGQVGIDEDDPAVKDREFPDMLEKPTLVTFPDKDDPIVHISVGIHNNLAVTQGGALYTWGTGPQSELGAGDETELRTPKMIVRKDGGSWAATAGSCGGQHTLALLRKKT
ncbi:hypothetical protein EW026_g5529 [Hermanssonia centrifuga]|uniref:RCC1-like domain-containing protein n=1 Tax=Hermanssonia centrifuga TaxID=98765 RepID=A0A4S4KEW9_9APHY|nr:hypothetical protein EW026_g5529 [Hermanssonia centrifuga]